MLKKTIISKGFIYIFLYVVTSAVSNVFVNYTARSVNPIISLFYSSLFTIIFFTFLNLKEFTKNIVLVKENKIAILCLNLLNAIIWFVIFFSLKELSPSVFSCLFLGAIPISIFLLELRKSKISKKNNFIIGLLLLAMFILMTILVFQDVSEVNFFQVLIYGAIVVIVGGSVAAFIMKISKKLAVKNVPASLVVSLRFYGLLVVSFVLVFFTSNQFLVKPILLLQIFILSLFSMALPLFLLQKALKTLSPLFASIIITIIPVLTYFLQLSTGYYSFSLIKLQITILFSMCLIVLAYVKKKGEGIRIHKN